MTPQEKPITPEELTRAELHKGATFLLRLQSHGGPDVCRGWRKDAVCPPNDHYEAWLVKHGPALLTAAEERNSLAEKLAAKLWECSSCGFAFDRAHSFEDGSFTCPKCEHAGKLDDWTGIVCPDCHVEYEAKSVLAEKLATATAALEGLFHGKHSDLCQQSWDVPIEERGKWRHERGVDTPGPNRCPFCFRHEIAREALAAIRGERT